MTGLTPRQVAILDYLHAYVAAHGFSPSLRTVMPIFGIGTPGGVEAHLAALQRKGYIKRLPFVAGKNSLGQEGRWRFVTDLESSGLRQGFRNHCEPACAADYSQAVGL